MVLLSILLPVCATFINDRHDTKKTTKVELNLAWVAVKWL